MTSAVVRVPGASILVRAGAEARPVDRATSASPTVRMAAAMVSAARISSVVT